MKSIESQVTVFETFYHGHDMHNIVQAWYSTHKWKANMKSYRTIIIETISTKPIQQTQQKLPKPYSNNIFSKAQYKLNIQEIKGYKHEILWEKWKTHTFSWSLKKRWWWKWWIFEREQGEFVSQMNEQDNKQSQWVRENWKVFKNALEITLIVQNKAIFVTKMSCEQVAKASCQKPLWQNVEKLSEVFFMTGRSTREEVAKGAAKLSEYTSRLELPLVNKSPNWVTRNLKTPDFWKIF